MVLLDLLGAKGSVHELAVRYLHVLVPSMPLVSLAMCMNAGLRSLGDAQLSMNSALAGGAVNAIMDPVLIFLLGWHIEGAAAASVLARLTILSVSSYGILVKHRLITRFCLTRFAKDLREIVSVSIPAVVTNLAMPVSGAWIISYLARFGDGYVAGYAIIGRMTPVAFGVIFALSGAIGPIIGQNFGAGLMGRVRQSLADALLFTFAYVLITAMVLLVLQDAIVFLFNVDSEAEELVRFFCTYTAVTFIFTGFMFVVNASFNNLGKAIYSSLLNWGRALIGTVPFVWWGANWMGANGVLLGQAVGGVVFAIISVSCGFLFINRVEKKLLATQAMEETVLPCTMNLMSSECSQMGQMAEEAELDELSDNSLKAAQIMS